LGAIRKFSLVLLLGLLGKANLW